MRRTKIVATLGPSTDDPKVMEQLFRAGLDVVRLNYSHGTAEDHKRRADMVRSVSGNIRSYVGILADLQGPKIRVARFKNGKVQLDRNARFTLDIGFDPDRGDENQVGCFYEELPSDVKAGNVLMLDDGRIVLEVDAVEGKRIVCRVVVGGELSDHKGINLQGGGLSAPALTDKDREDIKAAAAIGVDYVAVSFPTSANDIHEARRLVRAAGSNAGIVAKIERAEALDSIEEIIEASDVIMVARGDLGVEIGDAVLPPVQKRLIETARKMDTAVIIATQMMESMIQNPLPTRAEVFDVANAVFDGTDAVMLSGETAAGQYPVKAVEAVHRVCLETEKQPRLKTHTTHDDVRFSRIDEAIAKSTMFVANHCQIHAIVALTESGATAIWMSRISSAIPIIAMTSHARTCRKVTLLRGVYPLSFKVETSDHAVVNKAAIEELERRDMVTKGEHIIITKGDLSGVQGGTNAMKIIRVGDEINPD